MQGLVSTFSTVYEAFMFTVACFVFVKKKLGRSDALWGLIFFLLAGVDL